MELSAGGGDASPPRPGAASHAIRLALVFAVFAAARAPFLTPAALVRGVSGDHAVFALMGKKIFEGSGVDVFFWGQSYLGPLTPIVAALLGGISRLLGATPAYGPLTFRLAGLLELAAGIGLYYVAFTALFGVEAATLAALLLAAGPPFLLAAGVATTAPGPEMVFLIDAALLFLAARLLTRGQDQPAGARERFLFGFVAGFGWWMNQGIVFVLAAVGLVFAGRTDTYRRLREKAPPGNRPEMLRKAERTLPLALGAFAGYSPVLASRILQGPPEVRYQGPAFLLFPVELAANLRGLVRTFVRPALGIEAGIAGGLFAAGLLASIALLVWQSRSELSKLVRLRPGRYSGVTLALLVILLDTAFFVLQPRIPREVRYLAPAVPMIFALFAGGLVALWRLRARLPKLGPSPALLSVFFAFTAFWSLSSGAARTVRELLARPDPTPVIEAIAARGYRVCHAVSVAYEFHFLAAGRVAFIPYHSLDRNPKESARWRALPGPHCLLDASWNVRDFLPSDEQDQGGPARRRPAGR